MLYSNLDTVHINTHQCIIHYVATGNIEFTGKIHYPNSGHCQIYVNSLGFNWLKMTVLILPKQFEIKLELVGCKFCNKADNL